MTSAEVKALAKSLGADLVGITSMDRFEGAPMQMDPRYIMPEAKSMIVMAFRVMRGSLRGIEEGTFFSNYSAMGYGGLTYLYIPMTVINLCKYIEDEGYEAIPLGHQSDWRAINNSGELKKDWSVPVEPGKPAPDIMIHLRIAAYLAGLGEIGYSKMFLTPEFGPRVRIGVVMTEMELEPDPIYEGPQLCNKCMACVKACPGDCISATETIKVNLAGHEVEWGDIDVKKCNDYFVGGRRVEEGEPAGDYESEYRPGITRGPHTPFYHRPPKLYKSGQAVCGAAGCTRACMISMEARGVVKNKFHTKFRRNRPWHVDWSENGNVTFLDNKEEAVDTIKNEAD